MLLAGIDVVKPAAYTFECSYGAGGQFLTHMDIEYVGIVTTFRFVEIG